MKKAMAEHYDVAKGSLSDDPSDLNHLKHVAKQFDRALFNAIDQINNEFDFLKGLSRRMVELAEKAHKENNNS